jgi:UrcA family protein
MTKTALFLASVVAAYSAAAFAQPIEQIPSARVSYADLDLGREAGRATLEARVAHAVARLCPMSSGYELAATASYRACRKAAWSSVRPQLAAVYNGVRYANWAPTEAAARDQ